MIKTVGDLIDELKIFHSEMPICIRRNEGDGYFTDWYIHSPSEFYPGGKVCLSEFHAIDDTHCEKKYLQGNL